MDSSERFRLWYRQPIETLIAKDEHTGFAVLMLALPLLERHLRQKLCITKDNLDDSTGFHQRLVEPDLFPQLRNKENAKRFWKIFGHGLLHQATLQPIDGVTVAFVHNQVPIIDCSLNDEHIGVSPNKLALFVLDLIERDLPGFENIAGNKPLPTVATTAIGSSVCKI